MKRNIEKPVVSIITVNWDGKDDLMEMYTSLKQQTFLNYEAILVDNGSTDGSQDLVKKRFPNVRIIQLDKNYGFAEPNNIGFKKAKGKYIVTLNNDLKLEPNFLEELVHCADSTDNTVFSIGSKMIFYDDRSRINTIGIVPLRNGNGINLAKNENPDEYNENLKIYGPSAGAALYKKSIIDKIGFFDPEYFAYLEDLDLAHRANKAGYTSLYCARAICFHKHSKTSNRFPFYKLFLIERNRLYNLTKYYPWYYSILETPVTIYIVLAHIFAKKKKAKVSESQKSYFNISNIPKIIKIYIKARLALLNYHVTKSK